jgi:hypothetical protein
MAESDLSKSADKHCLQSYQELQPLIREEHGPSQIPVFLRPAWFRLFEQHISEANKSQWLYTDRQDKPPLVLPLLGRAAHKWGTKVTYLNGMSNFYSPMFDILGGGGIDSDYQQLLETEAGLLANTDCVNLLPLVDKQAKAWQSAFRQQGFRSHIYHHSVNWFHEDIRDLDHYWSLRPSRLRNTLKRKKDKLDKIGGYETRMLCAGSTEELIQGLIDYHQVYYHSWKKTEPWPAFIDAIAEYQWQQGELRLGLMYHQRQPVAAQLWFINGDTAFIYKLAHRTEYTPQSVGTVLSAQMFEQAIEHDKVSRIDFLTGDDHYKQDWMQQSQPLYGIQACNSRTLAGRALATINILSRLRKVAPVK